MIRVSTGISVEAIARRAARNTGALLHLLRAPFGPGEGGVLRIPIFIKFSSLSTLLIFLVAWGISFPVLENQREQVREQLLASGARMARILAGNAADKILNEEQLSLFQLVFDAAEDDQILRAVITDRERVVRADSLVRDIQIPFTPPPGARFVGEDRGVTIRSFSHGKENRILFEKAITFQKVPVGYAYLVFSEDSILRAIRDARVYILLITCVIVLLSIPLNLAFSVYFSRPIKALQESAKAVGDGIFDRRVEINRNDTLGDLGEAFNKMAMDLSLKEKIKDSFGRYVAPEVVDLVLEDPEEEWMKPAGVQASVLFVDIRGFTRMAENMEPELVVEKLNAHFTRVTDIVLRNGGHLNKFIGDEAMAVFGVPRPDAGHADEAIRTALELQEELAGNKNSEDPDFLFRVGIGVNSGVVVAGNLGSPKRMEYTIIGDPVNVASRLTSLAGAGEILVSRSTMLRLRNPDLYEMEDRGVVQIRGKRHGIQVFRVLGRTNRTKSNPSPDAVGMQSLALREGG
ncbi:MAG: adenylate/guanylate cyclase domain-containing protein [Deltaproteobacteria bacterium]|nr:adenylate/guanylate cyclase domain-containing protein [Deltaproteobacteria bacterium]MBW1923151.1 adenylate/guanylate cyclase domain-containing protein [Deltaproteobacteria bacterium]MBW1949272.1 adenylate/guanylate cyclase domain-containing protein [Deltaproteobacteria bacterium]MBW2008052.1 adenylate/guanylate cyclase domain-containing protein [Deltaproteobacteria bacterium]MBW2103010.1 adenylate/guanylate cyclase domain-containing protein [Deltaproteobacteria bacterium]